MKTIEGVIEAVAPPREKREKNGATYFSSWQSGVRVKGEWFNKTGDASVAVAFVKPLLKGLRVRIECAVVKDARGRDSNECVSIEVFKPSVEAASAAREGIVADFEFFLGAARGMGLGEDKIIAECAMHLNNQYQKKV
jgi:hypothetical protein